MTKSIVYDLMLNLMERSDDFNKLVKKYFVNYETKEQKEEAKKMIHLKLNEEIDDALDSMDNKLKDFLGLILSKIE